MQKTWSDGKKQRLEDCLNDFIIGLIKAATKIKLDRAEREEKDRQYQEQLRIRQEKARLRQEEVERVKGLDREVDGWHKAQRIRHYIEAVRQWGAEKHGGGIKAGSELERWITWALQQADRIDPLVDSPPSILDEKDEPDFSIFR